MTYYETEVKRISACIYANQSQLETVIGARKYINNHYSTGLSLDQLSRTHFVSKFHLQRLFRKYYGQTPKQYGTEVRIEKSKQYLKAGMSITETCFTIGFEAPSSFCTLFKSRTGLTPSEFQKRATFAKQL